MKPFITIQKTSALLKTLIPGLLGITVFIFENTLQGTLLQTTESHMTYPKLNPTGSFELLESLLNVLRTLRTGLFESYSNYLTFMLMVLLVDSLLQGFIFFKGLVSQKNDYSVYSAMRKLMQHPKGSCEKAQKNFLSIIKKIIIYSFLYCSYQAIWIGFGGLIMTESLQKLGTISPAPTSPMENFSLEILMPNERTLEEYSSLFLKDNQTRDHFDDSRSMSIGKILSEIDIEADAVVLSKDEKTAFVTGSIYSDQALFIIDISNIEFPIILNSRNLLVQGSTTLFLSSDESKLYLSDGDVLEVFEVSDLRSPERIGVGNDTIDIHSKSPGSHDKILISKEGKYLFRAGFGVQVFDISKPSTPICVISIPSSKPASIAFSPDKNRLYYTNGSLWIYDAQDPLNLKLQGSFTAKYPIYSVVTLNDAKTAYITGQLASKKTVVQRLNISDLTSIKEGPLAELDRETTAIPAFTGKSPDDRFLFVKFQAYNGYGRLLTMAAFDTKEERFSSHEKMFMITAKAVFVTKDSQKILVSSEKKLKIVELFTGFPNKNSFTESSNILQSFEAGLNFTSFTLASSNESLIYSTAPSTSSAGEFIFSIDRLDLNSKQLISIERYSMEENITGIQVSLDGNKAYWMSSLKIARILDITDPNNAGWWKSYQRESAEKYSLFDFLLSKDGKTGYLSYSENKNNIIEIVDFSTLKKKASIKIEQEFGCLKLSKDERILFIAGQMLAIYNITKGETPVLKSSMALFAKGLSQGKNEMILSQDETVLFINERTSSSLYTLRVVDVSNLTFPKVKSEFRIPQQSSSYKGRTIQVSKDSNRVYIMRDGDLVVIDVSSRSSPRHLGTIKTLNNDSIVDFKLGEDERKIYVATQKGKYHFVSTQAVYTTFLAENRLMLGERHHIDVMALALDKNLIYNSILESYRFNNFFLVESNVTLKMPPYWMNFDFKSQILTVEPRRKSDIQTYKVYFSFAKKIAEQKFYDAGFVGFGAERDLVVTLIGQGYLDSQLFLTDNFGELQDFILPSQYDKIRVPLYQFLKQYSFATFNEINVVSSLNLTIDSNKFHINTLNPASLKVDISLKTQNSRQAQFLSRNYGSLFPSIVGDKSRIVLEGSLTEVNLALKEVVINLENITSCDGQILIDDKLNPILNESLKDISRLFNKNKEPRENKKFPLTIQEQVNRHTIQTGQYFQIRFDPKSFSDDYTLVENLNYHVVFMKDNAECPLPNWITFSDTTLAGVAPETIVDREYNFMLIVKNEFQQFSKPFVLNVGISPSFGLKILVKNSPYILSILGLIIFLNKIYNILAKGRYKYEKEFYLTVGEEITPQVMFPITFIEEERNEAKKLLDYLKKDDEKLDKEMLSEKIKEYCEKEASSLLGEKFHKMIIDQLIFNHFTMKQLQLKEERETKRYFEKIKKQWSMFVEWDNSVSGFKINDEKLDGYLDSLQNKKVEDESMNEELLSGIKLDLLKSAILAHAFDCQNIDILPARVMFETKEKVKANFLKRFLRLDLINSPFNKGNRLGYGLRFKTEFNRIYFYGTAEKDFKSKTLIFQVKTLKQKILKEFWIHSADKQEGTEKVQRSNRSFRTFSELEARGQEYETF